MNCKQRAAECLDYVDNGLNVTWNFCMFMNNNTTICRERAIVDFDIIEKAVMDDTFKYDFGE
ncbi:hypothetical protein KIN20_036744 [Parelaphostrongylus tenuis]|nr:hypothetical protein KIN20_036744 [Parelaphostrongylus tenuis]